MIFDWADPVVARYYEAFCSAHDRYGQANRALVKRAEIVEGERVIDLGAGTGRTAEHIVPLVGASGEVLCVEPAAGMRSTGAARVRGQRVRWAPTLADAEQADCVISSAAIWLMTPIEQTFRMIRERLRSGGRLLFNIPSLYLGEPDEPGGGRDPWLVDLAVRLSEGRAPSAGPAAFRATAPEIDRWLERSGFRTERWSFSYKLTMSALRDWMKIPVVTNALLEHLDAEARAQRIDEVCESLDLESFRWERWTCWRASLRDASR